MYFSKNKAIYTQISDYISEEILKKSWRETEKIPSVREMAVTLQVNPNTVVRAYATLEQESIIEMKRGIGYFVSSNAIQNILNIKKSSFLSQELPDFFKTLDLLHINIEEIIQIYQNRNN